MLDGTTFLNLLDSRRSKYPWQFAGADLYAMKLGILAKVLIPIDLPDYAVVLDGLTDPSEYGKLLLRASSPGASDEAVAMRRYGYDPGAALLVLEAQERLLDFLSHCCSQLVPDYPVPRSIALGFFIPPDSLDQDTKILKGRGARNQLDRIESLLRGRLFQARDYIWLLREDPDYFRKEFSGFLEIHLQQYRNHERYKDAEPLEHSAMACMIFITHAYHTVDIFQELHQQAKTIRQMVDNFKADLSHIKELPEELRGAILKFRYYLTESVDTPVIPLQQDLPVSSEWLLLHQRRKANGENEDYYRLESGGQWFIWLLKQISAKKWPRSFTIPLFITEIEKAFDGCSPLAWGGLIVGTRFQSLLGDVALMSKCIFELAKYIPRDRGFKPNLSDGDSTLESNYMERFDGWCHIRDNLSDDLVTKLRAFAAPLQVGDFHSHHAKQLWAITDGIMYGRFQMHADSLVKQTQKQEYREQKAQGKQLTISVDDKSLQTFSSLFFVPSHIPKLHRAINWDDFMHAMKSTGLFKFPVKRLLPQIWIFEMFDDNRTVIFFEQSGFL
ncbi:hypothetical protein F5Y03DRAFT_407630 [Xylaria venustula]|nr:hypothetical protein F5Y03DRAFT_407630 [Xylaria venustula]